MASAATCYLLAGVVGSSGAWVLLDPESGLPRAMESAYGLDRVAAVKLSLFGALVQFAIAILWVVEDRPVWARRLTLLFLLLGSGHSLFLLRSDIKVACGCTAAPVGVSPRLINALSRRKNAILAGVASVRQFAERHRMSMLPLPSEMPPETPLSLEDFRARGGNGRTTWDTYAKFRGLKPAPVVEDDDQIVAEAKWMHEMLASGDFDRLEEWRLSVGFRPRLPK